MANYYDIFEQGDFLTEISSREAGELVQALVFYRRGVPVDPGKLPQSVRAVFNIEKRKIDAYREERTRIIESRSRAGKISAMNKRQHVSTHVDKRQQVSTGVKNAPPPSSPCITPPVFPLRGNTAPPDGGASEVSFGKNSDREREKREIRVRMRWIGRCIRRFYHRKASTAWADSEERKLSEIAKSPDSLRECRELFAFYRSGYEYTRKSVSVLLNNWQGELDRARSEERKEAKTKGGRFDGAF